MSARSRSVLRKGGEKMTSHTKTVQLRIITAVDGMVLTDGEAFSSVSGSVYLGVGDSLENWCEITAEEAEERKKRMAEEAGIE